MAKIKDLFNTMFAAMSALKQAFPQIDVKELRLRKFLIIGIAISSLVLIVSGVSRSIFPFDSGHHEGGLWAPSEILLEFKNAYSLEYSYEKPFAMSPYGVLYYVVVGLGMKLFGTQFWFARFLSVILSYVCCRAIYKIVMYSHGNKNGALLAVFIFLSAFPLQAWIGLQRPDILALCLSLVGLQLGLTKNAEGKLQRSVLTALLLTAAIFTRQTTIMPALFMGLWLLYQKKFKEFSIYCVVSAAVTVSIVVFLDYTSEGGYLWQQYIMPSGVVKDFEFLQVHLVRLIKDPFTVMVLLLCPWLYFNYRTSTPSLFSFRPDISVLMLQYTLAAFAIAAITSSRLGSNVNYWLEFFTAIALFIGTAFHGRINDILIIKHKFAVIALLAMILAVTFTGTRFLRGEYYRWKSAPYFYEIVNTLKSQTPNQEPVYSVNPEMVTLADRTYYINDFCQYDGRSASHAALQKNLLESGVFSAIINSDSVAPNGYYRVNMKHEVPGKVWPLFLHLRK